MDSETIHFLTSPAEVWKYIQWRYEQGMQNAGQRLLDVRRCLENEPDELFRSPSTAQTRAPTTGRWWSLLGPCWPSSLST